MPHINLFQQSTSVRRIPTDAVPMDHAQWSDIASAPTSRLRAAAARLLFTRLINSAGVLIVQSTDRRADTPLRGPTVYLHRPSDFYRRVGTSGLIGFGESYMAGDWDADDLPSVLTTFARNMTHAIPTQLQWLRPIALQRRPISIGDPLAIARHNVAQHYDLSNDLFSMFLDDTMTYSSALFEVDNDGIPVTSHMTQASGAALLSLAQKRKIDRLLSLTGVGQGTRVLEIGTGWGELAIRAASRGARVVTITLSDEQCTFARRRVAAAGLSDQVSVHLLDYREVVGEFDVIISVEMIEALGEHNWPSYFAAFSSHLTHDGRIGLQAITMPHSRMIASRRTQTWILKYIFPGGLLPSVAAIERNADRAGLEIVDRFDFGSHYSETLRIWRHQFSSHESLLPARFDSVFRRMWHFYLAYAEAGFASNYLQVSQFVLGRKKDETSGLQQ